jgi:hypothetical protein
MSLVPQDLPKYVELGGRQVWRPPYTARQAEVFGFAVQANRGKIDALLQEALVEPTKGAVDYRCAHDHIMVTFARIGQLASRDEPDRGCGYIAERELSFWCLAADAAGGHRLVWYLPYVFTDSGQTVATGREVYGYPKQIGTFENDFPDRLTQGGETTVQALSIDPFAPDSKAQPRPMITVQRQAPSPGDVITDSDQAGFSIFEEFTSLFPGEVETSTELPFTPTPTPQAVITAVDAPPPPRAPLPRDWVRRMITAIESITLGTNSAELIMSMINDPTLVFLKQFRDVSCQTKACYQAVVEAPLKVHLWGASYQRLQPSRFQIRIADLASHPIATDLGIAPGALTPGNAFHARFDFDIDLGEEVWRAPT